MDVISKTVELIERSSYIKDITKEYQEHQNPRILYAIEQPKSDIEIYYFKVPKITPQASDNIPDMSSNPLSNIFLGDKISYNPPEIFFVTFENIKYEDPAGLFSKDDNVISPFKSKIQLVKKFRQVRMLIEYKNHTILETENLDEANNVYRAMKERYTYLEEELVKDLRGQFEKI